MPYRHAHWFILLLLPASVVAFSSYLAELGEAGTAKHVHALFATLWILLLAAQSASIHHRQRGLHRTLGLAGFFIFPIYFAGFFLVFQSEAQRIVDGDPWATVFGPGIGTITLISALATAWMYHAAMRNRRNVHLHARWLLVTLFLFAESVLGRILNTFVPGLLVLGLDDIRRIYDAFHVSQLLAIALAVALYRGNPRYGQPFVFVTVALVAQSLALELFDDFAPWRTAFLAMASWPTAVLFVPALFLGAAVSWSGWVAGRSGRAPRLDSPLRHR
ncbi:MAG: hypothetical protein AAGE01_07840 [Pseudomonadota bacterium]